MSTIVIRLIAGVVLPTVGPKPRVFNAADQLAIGMHHLQGESVAHALGDVRLQRVIAVIPDVTDLREGVEPLVRPHQIAVDKPRAGKRSRI